MRIAIPCGLIFAALTAVAQDRPKDVIVVEGSVAKPGAYPFPDPSFNNTVTTAIAQAGGLIPSTPVEVFIVRIDDHGARRIPVALRDIMNRKKPDVMLQAGDTLRILPVWAPKKPTAPGIDIPKLQPAAPHAA
jgi:protein involved in polysaccharide export with SLBB domain